MAVSVDVGKYGRIVLPKEVRERYRVSSFYLVRLLMVGGKIGNF